MKLIPSTSVYTWNFALYPPVVSALPRATLTFRRLETDPRTPIPTVDWAHGDCTSRAFPGVPSNINICLRGGFQPDFIYEFIYTGKDPLVLGLGFAATRDLISFFRYVAADDYGTPNPLVESIRAAMGEGQSQPGRFMRTFLALGFNLDEYDTWFSRG